MSNPVQNRATDLHANLFYDKIKSIYSETDVGGNQNSYLQMLAGGLPIDIGYFNNNPPSTMTNPRGNPQTTTDFNNVASICVDVNGLIRDQNVQSVYEIIINTAQHLETPDQTLEERFNSVTSCLFDSQETNGIVKQVPSESYAKYQIAEIEHTTAIIRCTIARNNVDFQDPEQVRQWETESRELNLKIEKAKRAMDSYPDVKKALLSQETRANNAVLYTIALARRRFEASKIVLHDSIIRPSYAVPENWYKMDDCFTKVYIQEKKFQSKENIEFLNIKYLFELGIVQIKRPWFDPTIFSLDSWAMVGQKEGVISSGNCAQKVDDHKLLPYYAIALVIAKNIKIEFKKSSTMIRRANQIGPFNVEGKDIKEGEESVTIPGAQVIGVINRIVPKSPPNDGMGYTTPGHTGPKYTLSLSTRKAPCSDTFDNARGGLKVFWTDKHNKDHVVDLTNNNEVSVIFPISIGGYWYWRECSKDKDGKRKLQRTCFEDKNVNFVRVQFMRHNETSALKRIFGHITGQDLSGEYVSMFITGWIDSSSAP